MSRRDVQTEHFRRARRAIRVGFLINEISRQTGPDFTAYTLVLEQLLAARLGPITVHREAKPVLSRPDGASDAREVPRLSRRRQRPRQMRQLHVGSVLDSANLEKLGVLIPVLDAIVAALFASRGSPGPATPRGTPRPATP
jgi:hypothetical protein